MIALKIVRETCWKEPHSKQHLSTKKQWYSKRVELAVRVGTAIKTTFHFFLQRGRNILTESTEIYISLN